MRKVGYVLTAFPVLSETFVGTEIRAMEQLGHSVVPIAFEASSQPVQNKDLRFLDETQYVTDVTVADVLKTVPLRPGKLKEAYQFAACQTSVRMRSLMWQALKVATIAKKHGCQHLHAHFALNSAATAIVAARLLNISVSFVGHGFDIYVEPYDLALKLDSADFVIAVCDQMKQDFERLNPQSTVKLMHCGIDLMAFPFVEPLPFVNRLLFVGRLVEKKGISHLFQALSLMEPSSIPQIDLVGDGPLKTQLEHEIEVKGLAGHVRLLGVKDADWLKSNAHHYGGLVAPFCEASNGDKDTGPLVVKEAMALGLPVISTGFMGVKEIVDEHTGWKVAPSSALELAEAITEWQQMGANAREQMVIAARHRVETLFTAVETTKTLSNAINQVTYELSS